MPVNPTGGELHINSFTAGEQSTSSLEQGIVEPQQRPTRAVAMDPNGGFVVVWSSQGQDEPDNAGGWGVYAQRYDKTGNPVGVEFPINTTIAGDQLTPAIAMDAAGNFVVTWTSIPGDGRKAGVIARRFDKNGVALGGETVVNTYTFDDQQNSSIAMNATGDYIITWSSDGQDGDVSWGVYGQLYNADGTKKGGEIAINARTPDDISSPAILGEQQSSSVAIAPDGSFVVVWESNGQDGDKWGIYARRFNAAGVPQGNEVLVNTTTTRSQRNPSVAIDATGNFVVTWTSDAGVADGQEVYARRFNADGTPATTGATGEIKVNVNPFGSQQYSTVTMIPPNPNLPSGGFVVTWSSDSGEATGGSGSGVFLKRYNALGVPLEAEIQVNTYTLGNQSFSSAASDSNGNLAVVWTSENQATDANGGVYAQRFSASANPNVAPTNLAIAPVAIDENKGVNAVVGTFTTTDPNPGDSFTYTLVPGDGAIDNAAFTIGGVQNSQLLLTASANYEAQSSYSIRVRTTDQGGLFTEKALTISVNDVNEASTDIGLSTTTVNEKVPVDTPIGTISTVDPDTNDSFTYTLVDGAGATDNALFAITGNSLKIEEVPNFATKPAYSVRIRSTDLGGFTVEKAFTIAVNNIPDNPTDLALTPSDIAENQPLGTPVGIFSSVDPDGNNGVFTYTLVTGAGSTDNGAFTISGNQLLVNGPFDFETKPSYSIRVRTTDATGLFFEKVLAIVVDNVNEAPTSVALAPSQVDENVPLNTLVGNLTTVDPDANNTFTYTLVPGTGSDDNAAFTLSTAGVLRTNAPIDFETKPTYSIRVRTTDQGGLSVDQVLTVKVNDLLEAPDNQAPTDLSLAPSSIAENSPDNSIVGAFATVDPNVGDTTFLYSLVDGVGATDNAAFVVEGSNLRIVSSPNFEVKNAYSIRVRTRDNGGLSTEKVLTVNVTDVNEAPTDIGLSNLSVPENVPAATVVGTFSTTDPDTGSTFTYALVPGDGSTDNAAFTVFNNNGTYELQINASPNFEVKKTYSVRVRSTDQGNLSTDKILTINVTDLNEAPTDITLTPDNVNENVIAGTSVGNLQAIDEDANETATYKLVSGTGDTDNGLFTLTPVGQLIINTSPDYEKKQSYSIRVETTDKGGLTFTKVVTVKVNDIFEDGTPTNLQISNSNVPENSPPNTLIGQLTTLDPDSTVFTYTLVPGFGDNAAFTLNGDQLTINNPADFETKPAYQVKIRTTDDTGLSLEKVLTINVTNVNEAPTDLKLSNAVLDENTPNPVVGLLTTTDPDINDSFTYSLDAGGDNTAFTIVGNELRINTPPNFEAKPSYSIRITARDAGGLSITKDFPITINNLPEAPIDLTLSATQVDENQPIGTIVGSFTTTDQDVGDTHTYTLITGTGGEDNAAFDLVNNQLRLKVVPDFETKPQYSILVRTTDSTGRFLDKVFTIQVKDLPETPGTTTPQDLLLSKSNVDENQPVDALVGAFSTVDPDIGDAFTYSLVTGNGSDDNAAFKIVNNELRLNVVPDFETKTTYSIRVRTTDQGGLFLDKVFTIQVNNLPENPGETAPTDLALSKSNVDENQPVGTPIGTFSTTDPDIGDSFTYSLVEGNGSTENGAFTIVNNELRLNTVPDFEAKSSYSIRIRTTDVGGKFFEKAFTITVNDLPENPGETAPTDLALSKTNIDENQPAGTAVGTFSTVDPDKGDTHTYSLVAGTGSTDNAAFTIANNELRIN
ncbi:MAG TPA: cadherin domain-containing protein, partial [Coleofasciculaceae cyanobacterium]